jgi:hypothetical protein
MHEVSPIHAAAWIGYEPEPAGAPPPGAAPQSALYLDFARDVELDAVEDLQLEVSANSFFVVFMNDRFIGRGPAPGSRNLAFFHRFAVPAALLVPGTNRVAVRVFHDGEDTETVQGFDYGKPGLLLALARRDGGGPRILARTGAGWKVRRSPEFSRVTSMMSRWGGFKEFYHGEGYDAWRRPGFDLSAWAEAPVTGPALGPDRALRLEEVGLPPLREEIMEPRRLVDARGRGALLELPAGGGTFPSAWPPGSAGPSRRSSSTSAGRSPDARRSTSRQRARSVSSRPGTGRASTSTGQTLCASQDPSAPGTHSTGGPSATSSSRS